MKTIKKLSYGVVLSAVVALCATTANAASTAAYVQDGLIACWDGLENAGAGQPHDDNATVWRDVVHGYEFNLTGVTVEADRMTFAGTATSYGVLSSTDTDSTFDVATNGTLEVVYVAPNSVSQVLLQAPATSGMAFSFFKKDNSSPWLFIPRSGTSQRVFDFSPGPATNSISVRYNSGIPMSALANGVSLNANGQNYWGSHGSETTIGTRQSKENNHFPGSIYCIRLYNRQLTDEEITANHIADVGRFHTRDGINVSSELESRHASPVVSFDGDAISVEVAEGAATNAALHLCWGTIDMGERIDAWDHSVCLTADGVMPTGGVWTASASALGIAPADMMRAVVVGPFVYKEVEYVETPAPVRPGSNDKILAVRTGVAAKTGLHVKTRMRWLDFSDMGFCGGRYTSGNEDLTRMTAVHSYNKKWYFGYGGLSTNTVACALNTDYEVESKLYHGLQTLSVDGSEIYAFNGASDVDTGGECGVFATYYKAKADSGTNPFGCQSHARFYYLKMWENGNTTDKPDGDLVRDFVPVKDTNGHGALYDKVSGKVFETVSRGYATPLHLDVGAETGALHADPEPQVACSRLKHYLYDDIAATVGRGQVTVVVQTRTVVGATNELVVCWGNRDYGDQAADWPNVLQDHYPVGEAGGTFVFNAEEISPNSTVRAFLVESMGLADYISSVDNSGPSDVSVYLDTGVKAKHGLRVQTSIEWLTIWDDFGFMGARPTSGNTRFFPIYGYKNGQWSMGYEEGAWNQGAFAVDTRYEVESKLYAGEQRLTVDGVDKYVGTNGAEPDYNVNIFAFAVNWYDPQQGTPKYGCRAKCYYLKMYTGGNTTTNPDGTLARDYVPAVLGGVGGMYDRLNDTFTASAGWGVFKYGSVTNTTAWTATTYCTSAPSQTFGGGLSIFVR